MERSLDGPGAFEYGGSIAEAIRRFKYEGRSELGRPLGRALSRELLRDPPSVDVVVPVPLHWRRRRTRGYDQAALLAKQVSRALGVPLSLRALRRTRPTPRQAGLSRRERLRNVRHAFSCRPLVGAPRVLLIDDVSTTGATLAAAAGALAAAGAADVVARTLAVRVLR